MKDLSLHYIMKKLKSIEEEEKGKCFPSIEIFSDGGGRLMARTNIYFDTVEELFLILEGNQKEVEYNRVEDEGIE